MPHSERDHQIESAIFGSSFDFSGFTAAFNVLY